MARRFMILSIYLLTLLSLPFLSTPSRAEISKTSFMLALDASGSMRGGGIETIKSAAGVLIDRLPSGSELSLYTFSSKPVMLENFTSDKAKLKTSLAEIQSGGDTSLYDSIADLLEAAASHQASLIIFTDGKDSSSKKSLKEILDLVSRSQIKINFVTYQVAVKERVALAAIAGATQGGIYNATTVDELSNQFSEALRSVIASPTPTPESIPLPPRNRSHTLPLAIAGMTSVLAGLFLHLMNRARKRNSFVDRWSEVLDSYEVKKSDVTRGVEDSAIKARIEPILRRIMGDVDLLFPTSSDRTSRIALLSICFLATLILFSLSALPFLLSLLVASALFLFTLRFYIQRKSESILLAFERDLPSSLKLIAASLSAGLSFLQALETFATENKSEVARQFRRALAEIQMGTPVERALNGVAHRMKSKDLEWAVFAFSVQREVGGSLAKILATTAETIESRAEIRREVRTLSAEGRLSSYVLMALPVGIFVFLLFLRPQFISMFWEEQIGHILLAFIALSMTVAWLWIRRLIRITV